MVDPEGAGVTHIGCGELREGHGAGPPHRPGIGGRQVPVLPLGSQRIGRRADRDAHCQHPGVGPGLGSVGRRAHGQVAIEAERQARQPAPHGGLFQLGCGQPLQVLVEHDPVRPRPGERLDLRAVRIAKAGGPVAPRAGVDLGQGFEDREPPQRCTACGHEGVELGPRIGCAQGGGEALLQHRELDRPGAFVVDHGLGRERRDLIQRRGSGNAPETGAVHVHWIEEPAVRRMIGAGTVALPAEQGVKRIDPDSGGAGRGSGLGNLRQGGEVADPLIALAPQAVEVGRQAPSPAAIG